MLNIYHLKDYFSYVVICLKNISDNTSIWIQNIFYTTKTSRVTISRIIKLRYVPTRTELKRFDLWWSNDIYLSNKMYYAQTQQKIMKIYPFLDISQLKNHIISEMS